MPKLDRGSAVPQMASAPLESVTVSLPSEGLNPLLAGQLIVNMPEKFSLPWLALPDKIAVSVPEPFIAPEKMLPQPLVVPVSTAFCRRHQLHQRPVLRPAGAGGGDVSRGTRSAGRRRPGRDRLAGAT